MIERGEKREEYRLSPLYWRKRLHNWDRKFTVSTTPIVEFRRGYAKDAPRMAFRCTGIETASGLISYAYVDATATKRRHPEWGEPSDPHFFIELGGRVKLTDDEIAPFEPNQNFLRNPNAPSLPRSRRIRRPRPAKSSLFKPRQPFSTPINSRHLFPSASGARQARPPVRLYSIVTSKYISRKEPRSPCV